MAYGYQRQGGSNYGGGNQGGGGFQRSYQGNQGGGYQKQLKTPLPPLTPEEYLNEKIDAYLAFTEIIKQRGLDPADFSFYLGGWITSFGIINEKRAKGQE